MSTNSLRRIELYHCFSLTAIANYNFKIKEEIIIHISEKFHLAILGHKDIDFIDVDETWDTGLYIDPYVIQALPDKFCEDARKCIDSFFREVFEACRDKNIKRLRDLLEYASEPNETNLGMKSISEYGKGTSTDQLLKLFMEFYDIVRENLYRENNPLAQSMYIQNFDKDKMSDLITNIIRKLLYSFTVEQSNIWGISLGSDEVLIGNYWDCDTLSWKELHERPLSVGHKNILLVPKSIVRPRYVFNVGTYIKQYILKILQQEHVDKKTDMCSTKVNAYGRLIVVAPTRKELYNYEVRGTMCKQYALKFSTKNKSVEDEFVKDMSRRISEGYGTINEAQLDKIVYRKRVQSA